MNSRNRRVRPFVSLFCVAVIALCGCGKSRDRSVALRGVRTHTATLDARHTGMGGISIRLPEEYAAEWTEESKHDKFYIYRPNDTAAVQAGMLIIDITPAPLKSIPDTAVYEKVGGKIGEHAVEWRERVVVGDDNDTLYQREVASREPLAQRGRYNDTQALVLHAFVVGSNAMQVERLAAAVETIALLPMKPNL